MMLLNKIKKLFTKLSKKGVGYIEYDTTAGIVYKIDDKRFLIEIKEL